MISLSQSSDNSNFDPLRCLDMIRVPNLRRYMCENTTIKVVTLHNVNKLIKTQILISIFTLEDSKLILNEFFLASSMLNHPDRACCSDL